MDGNSFAPCGLICGLCRDIHKECKGCRFGGGDQDCYQLTCCRAKGIAGCWLCEDFPCDRGYFNDEQWKGVITGFARCVKKMGEEKFSGIVESKLGKSICYEDYLDKTEQEIINMLLS